MVEATTRKRVLVEIIIKTPNAKKAAKEIGGAADATDQLDKKQKQGQKDMRRFDGAALSLMFSGMALQRVFGGVVNETIGLSGVMDYLSDVLIDILEPILEPFIDAFESLIDWLDNTSPAVKTLVGAFVLLGFIIGTVLMVGGMMKLGFDALVAKGFIPLIAKVWEAITAFVALAQRGLALTIYNLGVTAASFWAAQVATYGLVGAIAVLMIQLALLGIGLLAVAFLFQTLWDGIHYVIEAIRYLASLDFTGNTLIDFLIMASRMLLNIKDLVLNLADALIALAFGDFNQVMESLGNIADLRFRKGEKAPFPTTHIKTPGEFLGGVKEGMTSLIGTPAISAPSLYETFGSGGETNIDNSTDTTIHEINIYKDEDMDKLLEKLNQKQTTDLRTQGLQG